MKLDIFILDSSMKLPYVDRVKMLSVTREFPATVFRHGFS